MDDAVPRLWDDEVGEIRQLVSDWAGDTVAPAAREADAALATPEAWWGGLTELGLDRAGWSEDHGGMGLSWATVAAVAEALAEADPGLAVIWAQHQVAGRLVGDAAPEDAIIGLALGDDEDSELGAPPFTNGAGGLDGSVESHGRGLITHLITNVGRQDDAHAHLVPVATMATIATSGLRTVPLARWKAIGAASEGLGERIEVRERAAVLLDPVIATITAGLAATARRDAIRFGEQRVQFGTAITEKEEMRQKFARMASGQLSVHALGWAAARAIDSEDGSSASLQRSAALAHAARLEASRVAVLAGEETVQIHGGYGYIKEYPAEKHYRDARHLLHMLGGPLSTGERMARLVIA